jgi:hypothetical protein
MSLFHLHRLAAASARHNRLSATNCNNLRNGFLLWSAGKRVSVSGCLGDQDEEDCRAFCGFCPPLVSSGVTNETGSCNFPSLQSGTYKVSAELPGFQTQIYNDVALGVSQQVRLNFTLQVGGQSQSVEVSVAADTLIAATSSSVGSVLPEYKIRDLPLATRTPRIR